VDVVVYGLFPQVLHGQNLKYGAVAAMAAALAVANSLLAVADLDRMREKQLGLSLAKVILYAQAELDVVHSHV
jgi:hypothetical protein